MTEASPNRYRDLIPWAEGVRANRVYPLSIAEGRQSGAIFLDRPEAPTCAVFWHGCGFAYISGDASEALLEELAADLCRRYRRRMVLITDDEIALRWLRQKQYAVARRIEYEYAGGPAGPAPTGVRLERIDERNLPRITGRIVPAFSWEGDRFLQGGFGYAALDGDEVCGAAFSAAVSSKEVDIGVEVRADHRRRGIAGALVRRMCEEILAQGKRPVWAHGEGNLASRATALACGFTERKINRYACLKQAE